MSARDGFIYNVLAMGAIFPWVYVWGPTSFPDANLYWALVIAFIAQIPISLSYAFLASALPIDAGDYEYQIRAFGRFGAIAVLAGFVICILEWLPISGWLCATLGLAPLLLSLGAGLGLPALTRLAVVIESPGGIIVVSLVLNLCAVLLLLKGLRVFARVQRLLFILTIIAIATMGIVFIWPNALDRLNSFAGTIATQLGFYLPLQEGQHFASVVIDDAAKHGYLMNGSQGFVHKLTSTLGLVPIAWTSLQWATYSVEQNREIEGSGILKNQLVMLLVSAFVVTVLLLIIAVSQQHGLRLLGREDPQAFLRSFDAINWSSKGSDGFILFSQRILQPYPNVLAIASSGSLLLSLLIALGFLANAFQIACNCFIGMGAIITAMSRDGILPRGLGPEWIDQSTNTPVRAYWTYLILGMPIIFLYGLVPNWNSYALSVVTVACGFVFFLTTVAAAKLPAITLRRVLVRARIRRVPVCALRALTCSGVLFSALMLGAYIFVPELGLQGKVPSVVFVVIVAVSCLIVLRRGLSLPQSDAEKISINAEKAQQKD